MDYKSIAIEAAKEAGEAINKLAQGKIKFEKKKRLDILAEADLKAEKIILGKINTAFPEHAIFSEEAGNASRADNGSDFLWLIDPLDGTVNFSRHIEQYAVSIALREKDEIILGVVYEPYSKNLYVAEKGKGAFLNGEKLSVNKEPVIENMILSTDNSSTKDWRMKNFKLLTNLCAKFRQVRIFGNGASHMTRIAVGETDAYIKVKYDPVSYPAGILMIEEAGGMVTSLEGGPIINDEDGIVATNGQAHDKILKLVKLNNGD